jgi:hypothetical protein
MLSKPLKTALERLAGDYLDHCMGIMSDKEFATEFREYYPAINNALIKDKQEKGDEQRRNYARIRRNLSR